MVPHIYSNYFRESKLYLYMNIYNISWYTLYNNIIWESQLWKGVQFLYLLSFLNIISIGFCYTLTDFFYCKILDHPAFFNYYYQLLPTAASC